MAKKKTIPKKKLLAYREVTVKSRAYGEHTRAARGSKTPVAINEALQRNVAKTAVINSTAKRVHDLLKVVAADFKERMLWQAMLGRMRTAVAGDIIGMLMTLKGMELNGKYPTKRFLQPDIASIEWDEKTCILTMRDAMPPRMKNGDAEYCMEVWLLTLGKEAEGDSVAGAVSDWIRIGEALEERQFVLAVPEGICYYLVGLHFMTGKGVKATETLASQGMRVMEVGSIGG